VAARRSSLEQARSRLIFALDVGSMSEALGLVRRLEDSVGMFKVGKQLFMQTGPRIINSIRDRGGEVFLDLKFHDIPRTVARASMEATRLGVAMFNVHASGSGEMMQQTVRAVRRTCRTERLRRPKMLAVTVLTSLSGTQLKEIGVRSRVVDQVVRLAKLAEDAGMDGVVASPQEIEAIRAVCSQSFEIVTPGIRSAGDALGDQKRVLSAGEAIRKGADYVVVGRPIREADDPVGEAERIVEEISDAIKKAGKRSRSG